MTMTLSTIMLFVLGLILIVRRSLLIAVVEGSSMMPTLTTGNRMLVWRWYLRRWLQKDSIVLINSLKVPSKPELDFVDSPHHVEGLEENESGLDANDSIIRDSVLDDIKPHTGGLLSLPFRRQPALGTQIKRLVGLPGDTVRLHRSKALWENIESMSSDSEFVSWTVPAGHCFVLGDNPDTSVDSRFYGAIPLRAIRGIAFYQFGER